VRFFALHEEKGLTFTQRTFIASSSITLPLDTTLSLIVHAVSSNASRGIINYFRFFVAKE
jgi:hypothetical protein